MSVRDHIKDNVVATLQGITIAAGYSFTMGEVTKKRYMWTDWGGNENWPKASLYPGSETHRHRIGFNIGDLFWDFGIRIFHKSDEAEDELESFQADIRTAMLETGSITRGGYAWDTCYVDTSESEDYFEEDRLHASIIMNFRIHYRESYG